MKTKFMMILVVPLLAAALLGGGQARAVSRKGERTVREPHYADMFYPGSGKQLKGMVETLLEQARLKLKTSDKLPEGRIVGLISPHAGLVYSGATAALGYRLLSGQKPNRVIILGVRHRGYPPGATIENVDGYRTPLGTVALDTLARELAGRTPFATAADDDHSLEVQLPLLQGALGEFTLVPIIVGRMPSADVALAAEQLAAALDDEGTVCIASGDFTHYGPRFGYTPFGRAENLPDRICDLDMGAVEKILDIDPEGFAGYVAKTGATICGEKTITILLSALKKRPAVESVLLEYTTSGEMTGDWSNSVSYAAIAFVEPGKKSESEDAADRKTAAEITERSTEPMEEFQLTEEQKKILIKTARDTLDTYITTKQIPEVAVDDPVLNEKCGAFVTLHGGVCGHGNLRGCIGYIEGVKPLIETIQDMAVSASTRDYRFPPVRPAELADIEIEISVLTPLKRETNPDNIVMGKHGVIVRKGRRHQGVFLPQVATETGWSKEEFMGQLCSQKAGLPSDAWKDPSTELFTFTAIVFGENDFE